LLDDPHLEAVGFWQRQETRTGTIRMPGQPVNFSQTPGAVGEPGPALGAHSSEVLAEAGYSENEMAALRATGALGGESCKNVSSYTG
jgi:crotonobetainyl-CoA:carnitine CoA-transferase CaiB-like acyl-CoA transferase